MVARALLICIAVAAIGLSGCQDVDRIPAAGNLAGERGGEDRAEKVAPGQRADSIGSAIQSDGGKNEISDSDGLATSADSRSETQVAEPLTESITALKPPTVRPAALPEVVLSAAHADACLIRVGDVFPEFRLPDFGRRPRTFDELRGETLSVVVFWSGDRLLAADHLRYLQERIAAYRDLGLKVVAINVGDPPPQVRAVADGLSSSMAVVLDAEGRFFARVGRDHLPRTYLLDRERRVLWFDIEFSRHTREMLEQAIHASLRST